MELTGARRGLQAVHEPISIAAEDEEDSNTKMTALEKIREKIVHALPPSASIDVADLSKIGWAFRLSLLHLLVYALAFLYLVVSGTLSEQAKKFLVVDKPDKSLAVCEVVPVAATGTYIADWKGYWNSDPSFDYQYEVYELSLTASAVKPSDYTAALEVFATQVKALGTRSANYDVISSLIAWITFRAIPNKAAGMEFRTYSQVSNVFAGLAVENPNQVDFLAPLTLSSSKGVCAMPAAPSWGSTPTFSTSDMKLVAPFPQHNVEPSPMPTQQPTTTQTAPSPELENTYNLRLTPPPYEPCPQQILVNSTALGVKKSAIHSVELDLRTAMVAFALNTGIIDTSALAQLYAFNFTFDSMPAVQRIYVSLNFPDMGQVFCYSAATKRRVCFAKDSNSGSHIYPVFTSTRLNQTATNDLRPCSCPGDAFDLGCNDGSHFQLALVFSRTNSDFLAINNGWKLQQLIVTAGVTTVMQKIANLAYAAVVVTGYESIVPGFVTGWITTNIYDFLSDVYKYTEFYTDFSSILDVDDSSILSFSLGGGFSGSGTSINRGGLRLYDLADLVIPKTNISQVSCRGTGIYIQEALVAISATPPVKLVQPFFSCHSTLLNAIIASTGIGAGNAALISSVFLTIVIFVLVQHVNSFDKTHKVIPPERKIALEKKADRDEKDRMKAQIQSLQQQVGEQQGGHKRFSSMALRSQISKLQKKNKQLSFAMSTLIDRLTVPNQQELKEAVAAALSPQSRYSASSGSESDGETVSEIEPEDEDDMHLFNPAGNAYSRRLHLSRAEPSPLGFMCW